ncbi:MAG: T9SS type A sorting domain-containing protein [Bacteroidetes bacterium]|nr:T9SS type A sorting domain-containing protein [Bacteroidota bacterium]
MKKILTLLLAGASSIAFAQSTATNFTATDCSGNSHTLFTELDAGKVVVLCWVMPCTSCISGASTDASTVQSMSNPNVAFYLVDDAGNTSCSTLNSWASTNGITTSAVFGNSGNAINMSNYGSTGMPKTVILGGGNCRQVFFNYNGTPSSSAVQAAINSALSPCTGIIENTKLNLALNIFPNPAATTAKINYTLIKSAEIKIEVMNQLGEKINSVSPGNQPAGKQEYPLNVESLSAGIYFVKVISGEAIQTAKLVIAR